MSIYRVEMRTFYEVDADSAEDALGYDAPMDELWNNAEYEVVYIR
jgi:hypothetical protein